MRNAPDHSQFELVPRVERVRTAVQAAFTEGPAAKYLGLKRLAFRALVFAGTIPFTFHTCNKRRIYLKSKLDEYLESLPEHRMPAREDSPKPALKGVGNS